MLKTALTLREEARVLNTVLSLTLFDEDENLFHDRASKFVNRVKLPVCQATKTPGIPPPHFGKGPGTEYDPRCCGGEN